MSSWRRWDWPPGPPPRFSTGCTDCCGNVDYSTSANCDVFDAETPCTGSGQAVGFFLRRARRGSRTKHYRVVVRGASQGAKRKVSRRCGRNRDRLGDFFWSDAAWFGTASGRRVGRAPRLPSRLRSSRCPILRARRASTRESAPSYGQPGSGCSSTLASPRSARAARRRLSSPSSRSPPSGSSSASAAKTYRRGGSG
jgi:hypothetical protein